MSAIYSYLEKDSRVYVITNIVYLSTKYMYIYILKTEQWCEGHFLSRKYRICLFFSIFDHNIFVDIWEQRNFDEVFATIHSLLLFFERVRLKKYVNILSIIAIVTVGIP